MMVLVAVAAADFSAMVALTRGEPEAPALFLIIGLFILLYDLLLYFTLEILKKFLGPTEGNGPTFAQTTATVLVLAAFVAVPVVMLVRLLMGA